MLGKSIFKFQNGGILSSIFAILSDIDGKYEWITFFRSTVSTPPLLGQPYQILLYGSPRVDENLQMVTENDDG